MGRPIEITRFELSATELRELAARTQAGAVVRRLLAIALVLEGHPREAAAQLNGMDRQTLRDWVLRYNAEGVAGLSSRCSPGRPRALHEAQMVELRSMVLEEGPDLERNKGGTGAAPIYRRRSRPAGRSAWPSARSASCCAGFA